MNIRAFLLGSAAAIAGCALAASAQAQTAAPLKVKSVEFTATPAPANALEMTQPYTRSQAIVTLADGSKKTFPMRYHVLHRSGEYVGGWYAGLIVDKAGKPLMQSAPMKGQVARGPFYSAGADGTSMLVVPGAKADGVKGNTVFLINHLEYETEADNVDPTKKPIRLYGALPMAMNLSVLDQDPKTGKLTPVKMSNVDFSGVDGLWIPCNGSTTPWKTHLGSEEYEPNAQYFESAPARGDEPLFRHHGQDRGARRRQCLSLRPSGRGEGRPRRQDDRHQALRHGPARVRARRRDARPQDRLSRRRRRRRDPRHVRGRQAGRPVGRHALCRQMDADQGRQFRRRQDRMDQARPCQQRRDQGAGRQGHQVQRHLGGGEARRRLASSRSMSMPAPAAKAGSPIQAEARHGEGGRLPGDPPLRRLSRRHHRVHQDGRPGPQRRRQEALHRHQLRAEGHDRRQEQEPAAGRHQARRRSEGPHLRRRL